MVSRLNEDFVNYEHDHLLVVDVSDILGDMHRTILAYGEHPIYNDLNAPNLAPFLWDIFEEVGYLPEGYRFISKNIMGVLDAAGQYFDHGYMSDLQRQCWHNVTQKLIDRMVEYRLYDQTHVNKFDFYNYADGTLYLRYTS